MPAPERLIVNPTLLLTGAEHGRHVRALAFAAAACG
jgi:hypothetical protein